MKQIQIDNLQRSLPFPRVLSSTMRACALHGLKRCGLPGDCEVAISIVSPRAIRTLNAQMRAIDAVTDVLSFPAIAWEGYTPGDVQSLPEPPEVNPETGRILLGDIIICIRRAQDQAEAYGHSLQREMAFLTVHGILHLAGYDHQTEEDERIMNSLCEEILSEMGVERR